MKLPRDLSGKELIKALERVGYVTTRADRQSCQVNARGCEPHHVTIPNHSPLRVGTLSAILTEVATHLKISRDQLVEKLGK